MYLCWEIIVSGHSTHKIICILTQRVHTIRRHSAEINIAYESVMHDHRLNFQAIRFIRDIITSAWIIAFSFIGTASIAVRGSIVKIQSLHIHASEYFQFIANAIGVIVTKADSFTIVIIQCKYTRCVVFQGVGSVIIAG